MRDRDIAVILSAIDIVIALLISMLSVDVVKLHRAVLSFTKKLLKKNCVTFL
jgi:hypothetical protein